MARRLDTSEAIRAIELVDASTLVTADGRPVVAASQYEGSAVTSDGRPIRAVSIAAGVADEGGYITPLALFEPGTMMTGDGRHVFAVMFFAVEGTAEPYIEGVPSLDALGGTFTLAESAAAGAVAGVLSGKTSGSTLSLADDAGGRVALSGNSVVRGATALNYETATSHSFTVRETLDGASNNPRDTVLSLAVTNVLDAASLGALALDDTSIPEDSAATVNITGATSGSTISLLSGSLPAGMALNSAARTITGTPTTAAVASFTLRETLADSPNSPRDTALSLEVAAVSAVAVILDDDFEQDHDGAAMFAVADGMRRRGLCRIIAAVATSAIDKAAPAMRGLLNYAELNSVPVGAWQGAQVTPTTVSTWTTPVASMTGQGNAVRSDFMDGAALYRQALEAETATNAIIVVAGPPCSLAAFMRSAAGGSSGLTGLQLLAAKVSRIVLMGGGDLSAGDSYNWQNDTAGTDAAYVAANSTVPVHFTGEAATSSVKCGPALTVNADHNPYKEAFETSSVGNDANGKRNAYDPATLHYAILQASGGWYSVQQGSNSITASTGGNTFTPGAGNHYRLVKAASDAAIGAELDALIAEADIAPYSPAAPTGLAAVDVTATSVEIDFTDPTGACGFEYQLNSGSWATLPLNRTITGLTAATAYNIAVRALRPGATGTASPALAVTTDAAAGITALYTGGTIGSMGEVSPANCYSDRAGTTPAVVDGPVGYITDSSGSGVPAVAVTDADRWTLRQDGARYYLEGDGTKKGYELGAATNLNFAQVAIVARAKQNSTAEWQSLVSKPHASGAHTWPYFRWALLGRNAAAYHASVDGLGVDTSASNLTIEHTVSLDTASFTARINGASVLNSTDDATITYPNSVKARIGSNGAGAEVYNGRIYKWAIFNRSLTADELATVEAWAAT